MSVVFPHELFDLTDEEAAKCLCELSKTIIDETEKVKDPEKVLDFVPDYCKRFVAYMVGFYTGLHAQFSYNESLLFIKSMIEDLKNDRTSLAESFIKHNKLDKRFKLTKEEVLKIMKQISKKSKVHPEIIIDEFEGKYKIFASYFLGYLDGLASQYFDPYRIQKEVTFIAEIYHICKKDVKDVVAKIKRIKSSYFEEKVRDVV